MSINKWMDKEAVVHTHNGLLLSHKEAELVLMRWMNLEPTIQSEASQKEENKYCILTHIYGNLEGWHCWSCSQSSRGDADTENGLMNQSGREEGEDGMNRECMAACAPCCALLSRSVVSNSVTSWTVAHQVPLSMGILQARILEWVAISFSRGSSQPKDWTQVSRTAGRFFTDWATGEAYTLKYVNR